MRRHSVVRSALAAAALIALSAPFSPPAVAQLADALARCHGLADESKRLACYDDASGRSRTAASTPAAPVAGATGAATASASAVAPVRPSLIGTAWMLDSSTTDRDFDIALYQPNYLLPIRYTDSPNNAPFSPLAVAAGTPDQKLDDIEAKFQISFKARLWKTLDRRWGVRAAYTQQNQWQVYNGDISRPFRETNYQPELILAYNPEMEFGGFRWRLATLSLNHQSNGRADPLSRSWNRLIGGAAVEKGNLVLQARAWYRFSESEDKDDNPDITDYMGYGDLTALYRLGGHTFKAMGRGNLGKGKGAGEFTWSSPPVLGPLRLYAQIFTGYGESMIDYNWNQTTVGAGITLNDLF
jgi:phospholipase A1